MLGSGTYVRRNGRRGILTAHHCLHRCEPETHLGVANQEMFIFLLKRGNVVRVEDVALREHMIARPSSDPYGPDLTFIELDNATAGRFDAIASPVSLAHPTEEALSRFTANRQFLAIAGFAYSDQQITRKEDIIFHYGKFMIFYTQRRRIERRGPWDYINIRCDYNKSPRLPPNFEGLSGAGIWSIRFHRTKRGQLDILESLLIGVAFYQTPLRNAKRTIRGHYVNSIYRN